MFEANNQALITPPVRARFFKFRIPIYSYSDERGSQPCIKVELYGSPGRFVPTQCSERKRSTHISHSAMHKLYSSVFQLGLGYSLNHEILLLVIALGLIVIILPGFLDTL